MAEIQAEVEEEDSQTHHYIYVAGHNSNTVSIIDTTTNKLIDIMPGFQDPAGFGYDSTNGNIYVDNHGSNYVSVVSGSTNKVLYNVTVGQGPVSPVFDPNNGNVYVTDFNTNDAPGNTVSVISTVLIPTQGIQNLINTIDSFNLPKGVTTSLEALNAALAQLNRSHDTPACNQLNAFLNQVNAKQNNGQLTPQQAAELTQQATAIQQAIGCSNTSGMLGQTNQLLNNVGPGDGGGDDNNDDDNP
jgi:YVTN family beta-propeller protein